MIINKIIMIKQVHNATIFAYLAYFQLLSHTYL